MEECIFCKIIEKKLPSKLIYEDDLIVAFNDINPKANVHILVVSKEHIKNLKEIKEEHKKLIFHIMKKIPLIAKTNNLNGFRTILNTGVEGGQEIDHLHFHILGGSTLPGF